MKKVILLLVIVVCYNCAEQKPTKSEVNTTSKEQEEVVVVEEEKLLDPTPKTQMNVTPPPPPEMLEIVEDDMEVTYEIEAEPDDIHFMTVTTSGEMKVRSKIIRKNEYNTEGYQPITENSFQKVLETPVSTFGADVDGASYSNTRRFLSDGQLPLKDAVRIEEFVNYFTYSYPQPRDGHPFAIYTETGPCPWNSEHQLLHIGLQGKKVATENLPNSNLVFLIDVSGSMDYGNKLPLLKKSFRLLLDQLGKKDKVALVVYAGAAGVVLPSTSCNEKEMILDAIDRLSAGGSTAGGEGIELAYKLAQQNFIKGGNNRVILATDGDFNVGASSDAAMVRLIEEKRKSGVYLSVLGFGTGNYKDSKMEQLANKGNGNYSYIDNLFEAKKVLVNEMGGTLLTIAKDVKLQIEFNPYKVQQYRLVGYENRILNREDFDDDKKDAGELGSGHSVTAIYELIPATDGENTTSGSVYTNTQMNQKAKESNELATIRFRYKQPDATQSTLIERTVDNSKTRNSNNFNFAAAVAEFGLLLRDSQYKGSANYTHVQSLAQSSKGADLEGYRSEFIRLVGMAETLSK